MAKDIKVTWFGNRSEIFPKIATWRITKGILKFEMGNKLIMIPTENALKIEVEG